ncbi:bacterio-opsin activator domain-containing protein [Natronomonas sp. EA1]|uniref:bacterio-opsin activator domain-containing protein n=1 Tax=Natronomonas sp. EA1 TaxID=3421655 RepID=UPI003EB898F7
MTVVAGVALAADAFGLGEALSTEVPAEIELTQIVPAGTRQRPSLRVETADTEAFEASVRRDSRVAELTVHSRRAGRTLYELDWTVTGNGLLSLTEEHDILLEHGRGTAEEWTLQIRAPTLDAFRRFHTDCQNQGIPLHVEWVSETPLTEAPRSGGEAESTAPPVSPVVGGSPDSDPPAESADVMPFRQIVENVEEVVWMTDPEKAEMLYVNPAYEEVWGRPREELYEEPRSFLDAIHPEDRERVQAALDAQTEGRYDETYRIVRPDGAVRWIRDRAVVIPGAGQDVYRVAGIAEDITERKRRERMLTGLHDVTHPLLRASSDDEIAELTVETVEAVVDTPLVSLYFADEKTGALRPAAHTDAVDEGTGDPSLFSEQRARMREALDEQSLRLYDDLDAQPAADGPTVRSALVAPVGDAGVLVAGDTTSGAFDEVDTEFVELLAANAGTALDRVAYEQHLEWQNEQLVDLSRLNTVIRTIDRALVEATTREEIETNVCRQLVENGSYAAAWIGERRTDRGVTIRAAAGVVDEVCDGETTVVENAPMVEELVDTAYHTGAARVVPALEETANTDRWHERLVDHGCRAAAAIPLDVGDARYGVLTVYATRAEPFDSEEVTLLRDLGQTIGRAIRAAETRRTLLTDTAVELEFEVTDTNSFFIAMSETLGCRLDLEGIVPLEEDRLLYYITMEGAEPETLSEQAADAAHIETARLLTETENGGVFEFRVTGASAIMPLVDYGATVSTASADHGVGRLTAEVAPETDTRTVLNGLRALCPSARLVSKRNVDRPTRTGKQFREQLTGRLTDRQLNALRAAYFAGYFEWPRESTAEEIAAPMDISSSTFHFHLRHALEKLLLSFFEPAAVSGS